MFRFPSFIFPLNPTQELNTKEMKGNYPETQNSGSTNSSNTIRGAHSSLLVFKKKRRRRRRKKNTIPLKFISALNGKFLNIKKKDFPKTFQEWPNFYLKRNCKLLPLFKLSFR